MEFQDRRRTQRVAIAGGYEVRLGRRIRVRVVDISATGALLAAEEQLPVGSRGRLQIPLGGSQFEAQVLVKREQPAAVSETYMLGVTVAPSQARHQEALEQFLRRAGN